MTADRLTQANDLLPFLTAVDGWTPFVESSGAWCWSHPGEPLAVYATPFWDNLGGIVVELATDGEAYARFLVPFQATGDPQADATDYLAAVRPLFTFRPFPPELL